MIPPLVVFKGRITTDECVAGFTATFTGRVATKEGWQVTFVVEPDPDNKCGITFSAPSRFTYTLVGDADCPSMSAGMSYNEWMTRQVIKILQDAQHK